MHELRLLACDSWMGNAIPAPPFSRCRRYSVRKEPRSHCDRHARGWGEAV